MDTKETILKEALHLFSTRGYDAVGVQEIVDRAGITKPSLYHYFGNKRGLFEAILEKNYDPFLKKIAVATEYNGDLDACLYALFTTFADFADKNRDFFRLRLTLDFVPTDNETHTIAQQYSQKVFFLIEELFKKAVTQHGNMQGRHAIYAASFIGMLHTNISLFFNKYISLDINDKHNALKYFMHGIFS